MKASAPRERSRIDKIYDEVSLRGEPQVALQGKCPTVLPVHVVLRRNAIQQIVSGNPLMAEHKPRYVVYGHSMAGVFLLLCRPRGRKTETGSNYFSRGHPR
jgi:hypothetical protein